MKCSAEGCDWEGELRGYRGHYLYRHESQPPDLPPTALELAREEGRREASKFSPELPAAKPAAKPAEPPRAKKSFEEEMGF